MKCKKCISYFLKYSNKLEYFSYFHPRNVMNMPRILPLVFFVLFAFNFYAQHPCIYNDMNELNQNPLSRIQQTKFEKNWQQSGTKILSPRALQVLPVVVHIIHDGPKGLLSDARVIQAIQFLNDGFSNSGNYSISQGINTEIRFCLAKQDANGNPTTGITRVQSTLTDLVAETQDTALKNFIHWDPYCYINIYVVNEITSTILGSGVQGYALGPSVHGSIKDGIVVEAGLTGNTSENTSTLIHEMGHYLGLYHTFEGGCKNDDCMIDGDKVCDTPPDASTASAICNDKINSCTTDTRSGFSSDQFDMITNFMDYGAAFCKIQFTQGQKQRMNLALNSLRNSLLNCNSCADPCPSPMTINILVDSLRNAIPTPVNLSLQASGVVTKTTWWDGQNLISTQRNFQHTFTTTGKHNIYVEVEGSDSRCVFRDTVCIDVYCPISFTHNLRDTICLAENTVWNLTVNSATDSVQVHWFIYNVEQANGKNFAWRNNGIGLNQIYFIIENKYCNIQSPIYHVLVGCTEICDNGTDDDGDGLIDGFDPNCCDEINTFYYDPCDDSCPNTLKNSFTNIQVKWTSPANLNWLDSNTPFVGDMDGDGDVEVIGYEIEIDANMQPWSKDILILDGKTGALEARYPYGRGAYSGNLAIADVDRNGKVDIFINKGVMRRVEYLGNGTFIQRWQTAPINNLQQASITDFNQDGIPEVYVNNAIYNALTGVQYVPANINISQGKTSLAFGNSGSAAVDVLSSTDCANCAGLELVLGNEVYSVRLNPANNIGNLNLEKKIANGTDGYTSMADFDLDGDLDALVVSSLQVMGLSGAVQFYVWDIKTQSMLFPPSTVNSFLANTAHPAIGDLNGDGRPDIAFNTRDSLYGFTYLNNRWNALFRISNVDRSGLSSLSLFDFDADGRSEIVYRDETRLQLINGMNGARLYTYPCISGTGVDYPTVADIDGDKEAELLCSCGGKLLTFEPSPKSWAFTRPVFNQALYYNVNINDDLTIPTHQQAHHLVSNKKQFNTYLSQYAFKSYEAADLFFKSIDAACDSDSIEIKIQFCNKGPADSNDSIFIAIYDSNPFISNASLIQYLSWPKIALAKDSCILLQRKIAKISGTFYFILNTKNNILTPITINTDQNSFYISECDYANNLLQKTIDLPQLVLNLGPDREICANESILLDGGKGYTKYTWIDGSQNQTLTVYNSGAYWLEVEGPCGEKYRDTVNVKIKAQTIIDLGQDKSVCVGDTLELQANGIKLKWTSKNQVLCDTCSKVKIIVTQSDLIEVFAQVDSFCFSYDSLRVLLNANTSINKSSLLCRGDVISIQGKTYNSDTTLTYTVDAALGCDTVVTHVIRQDTSNADLGADISLCKGDSFQYQSNPNLSITWDASQDLSCTNCNNPVIKPSNTNSIYKATIKTNLGCIYRDSLILNLRDMNQKQSTKNICKGDSLFYKSQWIKRDTIVFDTINSTMNCDTIHTIALTFEKLSLDLGKDTTICLGDSLMLTIPGFSNYSWTASPDLSCTDCSMPIIKPSKNTNIYTLEVRSPLGCSYTDQFVINTSNAINISETKMICRGDSIFWKDGWKKNTGNYIFKNTASICDTVFQLQLNWFPTLKLFNPDTIVCEGSTLQYSAQGTNSTKWISKNSISCDTCPVVNITALQNDNLILYSKDANQCDFIDSISIRVIPTQNVTSEVFLCLGEDSIQINNQWIKQDTNIVQNLKNIHQCDSIVNTTVLILSKAIYQFPDTITLEESTQYTIIYQPTRRPNENWSWQSDLPISCSSCDQAIVTATKDGEVLLTIEDENGCIQIHRIIFKIKKQTTKIIIPNIISPNGDQLNDVLDIFSDDPNLQINFLRVFDRWGELIYEVKNQTLQNYKPWNGTFRGKNVINGVYIIHGHFVFSNGKSQEVAQDISVIR